jgi:hypothetical protein
MADKATLMASFSYSEYLIIVEASYWFIPYATGQVDQKQPPPNVIALWWGGYPANLIAFSKPTFTINAGNLLYGFEFTLVSF